MAVNGYVCPKKSDPGTLEEKPVPVTTEPSSHLFLREPNTLWGGSVTKDRKLPASKE